MKITRIYGEIYWPDSVEDYLDKNPETSLDTHEIESMLRNRYERQLENALKKIQTAQRRAMNWMRDESAINPVSEALREIENLCKEVLEDTGNSAP